MPSCHISNRLSKPVKWSFFFTQLVPGGTEAFQKTPKTKIIKMVHMTQMLTAVPCEL